MKNKTLFDKVWDRHVVTAVENGPQVLYIDKHLIHEVTSPQAFAELEQRGFTVIPLELRHSRTLGGGFHCVTLDLVRSN